MLALPCPQCSAQIPVADDQPFRACAHCGCTLFLDLGAFVIHAYVAPKLDQTAAAGALIRFLKASEVTFEVSEVRPELVYLPFAVFSRHEGVASVPLTLIGGRSLPFDAKAFSGALGPYDPTKAKGIILEPDQTLEEARAKLGAGADEPARLVHVPFYRVAYRAVGRRYELVVSALDGDGHAELLPPASSAALDKNYAMWAGAATLTFIAESAVMPSPLIAMAVMGPTILFFWWLLLGVQRAHR